MNVSIPVVQPQMADLTGFSGLLGDLPAGEGGAQAGRMLVFDGTVADSIVIPDGALLLGGDYQRQGSDLLIVGRDGDQVLVRDFFSDGTPPDLSTVDGAVISADLAARLAGPLAPGQYAQAGALGAAEPIGSVETVSGKVEAVRTDGTRVSLSEGDPVFSGDVLETADGGAVSVVFVDETTLGLDADSRMTLDEMVYDPGTQEGEMGLTLLQGALTFVSGQIAKTEPDAMTISTPTATIGIRGTAGGIQHIIRGCTGQRWRSRPR